LGKHIALLRPLAGVKGAGYTLPNNLVPAVGPSASGSDPSGVAAGLKYEAPPNMSLFDISLKKVKAALPSVGFRS